MTDTVSSHDQRPGAAPLTMAVVRALGLLGDLRTLHPDVTSGHLERTLRAEVDRLTQHPSAARAIGPEHPAVAAVRTACAHLATRAYEDTYLALVTARGLLPRHHPATDDLATA